MPHVLKTAATTLPVSLEDAKDHLRVDINDDDVLIDRMVQAITESFERMYNTALITQTWTLYADNWPATQFVLPRMPLQSVTHVKYTPYGGSQTAFDSSKYHVDTYSKPGRIILESRSSWPSDELIDVNGIEIEFVAGYGDNESDVPEPVRQAMLLTLGDWYENREDMIIAQGVTIHDQRLQKILMANYREYHF